MLPPAPKDVGRLSHVFTSAFASVGGDVENILRLPKVNHAVVILIDGLGYENLLKAKSYSRFLNSKLGESIRCEFPSTTATSLAGMATGLRSVDHGILGYSVYDRVNRSPINLLNGWSSRSQARAFKKASTISERDTEVSIRVIGPTVYQSSGFTELTMAGAEYLAEDSIEDRLYRSSRGTGSKTLTYLYIPELDQLAHRFGVGSLAWLNELEAIDGLISNFIERLPSDFGVIITADHGVLDVPREAHVMLDAFAWYLDDVEYTAGDPRCNFLYLKEPKSITSTKSKLQDAFGNDAIICDVEDLKRAGWADWTSINAKAVAPELLIIWHSEMVGYDRRFAKSTHVKMVGQHGAISDVETRIPLIKLGKY